MKGILEITKITDIIHIALYVRGLLPQKVGNKNF